MREGGHLHEPFVLSSCAVKNRLLKQDATYSVQSVLWIQLQSMSLRRSFELMITFPFLFNKVLVCE